jgi:lysophospholipase L1-like esterase
MPLFTSSSDLADSSAQGRKTTRRLWRATIVTIASMALIIFSAEIFSRYAFPRFSQIERRISGDERQLTVLGDPTPGSAPTVVLVGNSLLLRGLEYPRIQTEMASDARILRLVIENTEYLDWYYGLHHLFVSGVRPSMVVVCLNLGQTVSTRTLGDYSARHLFGVADLLPVAHDAGMSATQTTGLVLAHWSAFYASRATIRNFILNKADPPYATVLHSLADGAVNSLPADNELLTIARVRLNAIEQLCTRYGVTFVLLIPPSLGRRNDLLESAARLQNVNYDYPLPSGTLGPEFFRADGTHLNEKGATVFTDAIERCLRVRINKPSQQAP